MIKRLLAAAAVVGAVAALAAPASADPVTVCYGATVVVNGQPVVDQSDCQP